ncbi:LPS-assembly protein LptD [Acanthopleuribacter pedis]|uniref:LPS-assembly protein LptD n=1 Tax=Acanthopleuribacter pedis TaxID=442870 RepID=A0A8J7QDF4_9BACT|nr:putative LPS assembly protein LptD [Acanthopleuribacter pedis]MBO1322497.1 LPS-assembly protein LptD [Acanthopleuribacter pedis]
MLFRLLLAAWLMLGGAPLSAQADLADRELIIQHLGDQYRDAEGRQIVTGGVRVTIGRDILMTADELIYYTNTNVIEAAGNVKIDYTTEMGVIEIAAQTVRYDVNNRGAVFEEVFSQFGDEFYFVGSRLEAYDRGTYFVINNGKVTACNQPVAQWSMDISHATIERGGYAVVRNAKFRIKRLPVIYLPWFIIPVLSQRQSGFLQPDTGSSDRNGSFFSVPYYWAPRADFDATFVPAYADKAGFNLDLEMRYMPRHNFLGELKGTFYLDNIIGDQAVADRPTEDGKPLKKKRFRADWFHRQKLWNADFTMDIESGSDFSVDRDFLEEAEQTRIRDYTYRARWARGVGRDHLSINLGRLDRILSLTEAERANGLNPAVIGIHALPDVRYYQPKRHIGAGFYYRNQIYAGWYEFDNLGGNQLDGDLSRFGMDLELSRPVELTSFLHARLGVAAFGASYSGDLSSAVPDGNETPGNDNDVKRDEERGSAFGFAELLGPRLRRTYDLEDRRLVHYFDTGVDIRAGVGRRKDSFIESIEMDELEIRLNQTRDDVSSVWRMNHRLFTGPRGKVRPLGEIEVSQEVSWESDNGADRPNEPIKARFRLSGLGGLHGNGFIDYNPDEGVLDALSFYGSVNKGNWRGYGGYVKRRSSTDMNQVQQESFIGISELRLDRFRSRFKLYIDYDILQSDVKSQQLLYGYQGQCVGFTINYVRSPFDSSNANNQDFLRFTVNLRNLGELGTKF